MNVRPDILGVARNLGARLRRSGGERIGPCPVCGGRDRFSINPRKQLWNCRGCGRGGDSIDLLRHLTGASFVEAVAQLGCDVGPNGPPQQKKASKGNEAKGGIGPNGPGLPSGECDHAASVRRIVSQLDPVIGSPGEQNLREVRRIDVDAIRDVLERTDAIGWNPAVFFNEPGHPLHRQLLGCIVGVMTDVRTAEVTGAISRTYLDAEGRKLGKAKTLGSPAGIVRLSEDADVLEGLHIAEGLETALAAMSIGLRPTWATGSTALMAKFPVLSGIEALTIIADNDANGAGERAANEVALRWLQAGRKARVIVWDGIGDINDALRAGGDEP